MTRNTIVVPPRTGLKCIVRYGSAWHVWTGIQDMQLPYDKWVGTLLILHDNGTAQSVQVQPDGSEDTMWIK